MKAEIHNLSMWIDETNPEVLKAKYKTLLINCGFMIENQIEKHFEPFGFTMLYLLSESHFAIHTFPEHKTTYIELSSCVKEPFEMFARNHYQIKK